MTTKDVTWQPTERRRIHIPTKGKFRWFVLLGLLGINIMVILYHGDPRNHLAAATIDSTKRVSQPNSTSQSVVTNAIPVQTSTASVNSGKAISTSTFNKSETPVIGTEADTAIHVELEKPISESEQHKAVPGIITAFDTLVGLRLPEPTPRVENVVLVPGQTASEILHKFGASRDDISKALSSLKDLVDFRMLKPGSKFLAKFDKEERLSSLEIRSSMTERAQTVRQPDSIWQAQAIHVQVNKIMVQVTGVIETSLWDSVISQGEAPKIVLELVEIFGWDIDFYRDIYPKDSFRILVEKNFVDGQFVDYGSIQAAEFICSNQHYQAFRFQAQDQGVAYYDTIGMSLKKQLLKSPLQYGRVTSHFGNRRHPILGYSRQHYGVDYSVPIGTPVWTVGDGRVVKAGWYPGYGKLVEIRHSNGWISQYAHLSRINVNAGLRVFQKDIIGRVGSTGMSTGPHLHYGLKHHHKFVNPATQKFERAQPLTGTDLHNFKRHLIQLLPLFQKDHMVQKQLPVLWPEG